MKNDILKKQKRDFMKNRGCHDAYYQEREACGIQIGINRSGRERC